MKTKKSGYDYLKERVAELKNQVSMLEQTRDFIGERYVWLYHHAPFWLKWWFKKQFKK